MHRVRLLFVFVLQLLRRPEQALGRSFLLERYGLAPTTTRSGSSLAADVKDLKHGVWTTSAAPRVLSTQPPPPPPAAEGGSIPFVLTDTHLDKSSPPKDAALDSPSRRQRTRPIDRYGSGPSQVSGGGGGSPQHVVRGRTAASAASVLPRFYRRNPHAFPELTPADAALGVLNLVNRGRIPAHMDVGPALSSEPAPLKPSPAPFYHHHTQFEKPKPPPPAPMPAQPLPASTTAQNAFNLNTVKLNMSQTLFAGRRDGADDDDAQTDYPLPNAPSPLASLPVAAPVREDEKKGISDPNATADPHHSSTGSLRRSTLRPKAISFGATSSAAAAAVRSGLSSPPSQSSQVALAAAAAEAERVRGYNELLDTYSLHQFMIRRGRVVSNTPEFVSFNRKYNHLWMQISSIIRRVSTYPPSSSSSLSFSNSLFVAVCAFDPVLVGGFADPIPSKHGVGERSARGRVSVRHRQQQRRSCRFGCGRDGSAALHRTRRQNQRAEPSARPPVQRPRRSVDGCYQDSSHVSHVPTAQAVPAASDAGVLCCPHSRRVAAARGAHTHALDGGCAVALEAGAVAGQRAAAVHDPMEHALGAQAARGRACAESVGACAPARFSAQLCRARKLTTLKAV